MAAPRPHDRIARFDCWSEVRRCIPTRQEKIRPAARRSAAELRPVEDQLAGAARHGGGLPDPAVALRRRRQERHRQHVGLRLPVRRRFRRLPVRHSAAGAADRARTAAPARATRAQQTEGAAGALRGAGWQSNSNLVEISDWLTKIIVGLGLIHLKDVPVGRPAPGRPRGGRLRRCRAGAAVRGLPDGAADRVHAARLRHRLPLHAHLPAGRAAPRRRRDAARRAAAGGVGQARPRDRRCRQRCPRSAWRRHPTLRSRPRCLRAASCSRPSASRSGWRCRPTPRHHRRQDDGAGARVRAGARRPCPAATRARVRCRASWCRCAASALAALPVLRQLSESASPGERLAAIAILQTRFDPAYIHWLAECVINEVPFVGFHAAVALFQASKIVGEPVRKRIAGRTAARQGGAGGQELCRRQPRPVDRRRAGRVVMAPVAFGRSYSCSPLACATSISRGRVTAFFTARISAITLTAISGGVLLPM